LIESLALCSNINASNSKLLWLITFDSGSAQYSNKTPAAFNFTTTHNQSFGPRIEDYHFGFVNAVPNFVGYWHNGAEDHTENDTDGYMYLVNVGTQNEPLFNFTANNLCIGLQYEFSAYLANFEIFILFPTRTNLNIRFEVRTATTNKALAQNSTGNISRNNPMTWSKHGLSFVASNSSINLLMFSNVESRDNGNNVAIDDIELRVCSVTHSGICPPGYYIYFI
jgi:hypothetical protein